MKFVQFKSIKIVNFLSVGKNPVKIHFKPGVGVITGINYDKEDSKNGVGKSTIVEALHFALFGTTIRDLNKDLIVNSINKEKCEVEIEFEIKTSNSYTTYKIVRTLQPTKCFIYKDNVDVTRSTLAKTNEYIQKLLNTTSKIFQNSVIMTVNNTVPFMAQSKVDKRKFIESVLNLQIFSDMLLRARDEHSGLKKEYEIKHEKKNVIEKHYTFNKQQLDLFETNKQEKITNILEKITNDQATIKTLLNQITNLPPELPDKIKQKEDTLKNKKNDIDILSHTALQDKANVQAEINVITKQINELNSQDGVECIVCKRPFTSEDQLHKTQNCNKLQHKLDELNEKLETVKNQIKKINDGKDTIERSLQDLNKQKQNYNDIISQNNNIQNKIQYIEENITNLNKNLKDAQEEKNTELEKTVKQTENDIIQLQLEIDAYNIELNVLECVKFIVSEEGVKSYIVKKILKLLNTRLSYYLSVLQTNCTCEFNEYFDETITDEQGEVKSYFNFSGGERKRIDLACLFAFLDVRRMQGDINFSTIFYDELLDSSLDDKGVSLVLKILQERKEKFNESCYIITHRGSTILSEVDSIINLEKRNGFTYLLE